MEAVPVASSFISAVLFWPLVVTAAVLAAVYYYMETSRIVKLGNKLPGPPTIPFFGNAHLVMGLKPKDLLTTALTYDVYGPVVRVFFGPKLLVFLTDPRDLEIILGSSVHIDKSPEYRFFAPWLGEGLLISTGEKWRTHRKFIAPTFHLNVLKSFVPLFYQNGLELVQRLKSEVGKEFDCHDYMSRITVDILIETAMGVKGSKKEKSSFDYAMAVMHLCNIIHQRQYNILLRPDALYQFSSYAKQQVKFLDTIHSLTSRVISTRKAQFYSKAEAPATDSAKKDADSSSTARTASQDKTANLRYVRDDLDEIDENDVVSRCMTLKRNQYLD